MTDLAIVESRADRASRHVCDHLRDLADWEVREDADLADADGGDTYYRTDGAELRTFDALHLDLDRPATAFDCDPDVLVFASRHSGETGPLLTAHFTGNFGPAEFGGEDDSLAEACPNALDHLLEAFETHAPEGYDVGTECTHHGPSDVGCPSLFAELGSGDEQWDDPDGAAAVARSILELRGVDPHAAPLGDVDATATEPVDRSPRRHVVGFGDAHYLPRMDRIRRETEWAVGHVASDWALEAMGHPGAHREALEAAFATSRAGIALVEGDRPVLAETLDDLGYRAVSETWLRETDDRDLALVDAVESDLGAIDEGVRFGDRREAEYAVVSLPIDLVDAAEGVDPDRVRELVADRAVAYATENGGSRVGDRAALPARETRRRLIEDLAGVLEDAYETVRLEDDAVVVEETGFDPALAEAAGVPEGPKFGALANGESVTVDGNRIDPGQVRTERTDRFPI